MASFAATAEAAPHENHTTTLESFISLPAYLLPPEGAAELAETSITPVGGGRGAEDGRDSELVRIIRNSFRVTHSTNGQFGGAS